MASLDTDQLARLAYFGLLLAFLIGGIGYRRGLRRAGFQHLIVWAGIVLALVALYAYRGPLQRLAAPVLAELDPSRAVVVADADGATQFSILRGLDGHFHVDAEVNNGARIRFLIDTGASSTVLTSADAARGGIDVTMLAFDSPVQTANGMALSARTVIQSLRVGPFELKELRAGVMPDTALNTSLLGMNAIDRFSSWRMDGDKMVLVP